MRSTTPTPYYTSEIPCLGFARVDEPSHPPAGQVPTTSPVCPIHLLDVLTTCIIDNACVWSNITTGALQRLFPNRWQKWIHPTNEALDSATHHPLPIIGRIVKAKMELGSIRFDHDIQVVKDKEPRFLLGNDLIYDRITIHESRFITVRCTKDGAAREIVPIQYGAPLMFGVLTEDIVIRESTGMRITIEVQIDPAAANRTADDFVSKLRGKEISLESIRYGPNVDPDFPIKVEEAVGILSNDNKAVVVIQNPTFTRVKLEKGTKLVRVTPVKREGAYFVQTQTPHEVDEMFGDWGENVELSKLSDCVDEIPPAKSWNGIAKPNHEKLPASEIGQSQKPRPQALYLHSHDEDIRHLMEGAPDGEMPLPPGYELPELSPDRQEYHIEDVKTPYLTEAQRAMVLTVCRRNKGAFAQHDADVGCCRYEEHDLDVGSSDPVTQTYRPCPRAYVEEATKIIENMLDLGIIEESDSEYGQNLVIVRKASGKLRLCVDLRAINEKLVPSSKPAWPIPHVEESFEKFSSAEFISKLDLTNAYWCLKLTPRSRKVTAFYFRNRLFHFIRAPFGAANLPSVFARVMCKMLRGMRSFSWSFFDDIAIMSESFEEHLQHLGKVLARIEEAGFKVRADKCRICVPKSEPLDWLGHIVCNGQLLCDPKKVQAIKDTPEPRNADDAIKYVSALNFMSRHYPWFAQVVIPLYDLKVKANKKEPFHFGEKEREAFELSKQMAINAPALELPRYSAELLITSDASTESCAGMLSMLVEDETTKEIREVACGYVSRRFTEAERKRKSVPECEMTALIFTITAFSYYLIGRPSFTVRTDASSLLYLHKFKESNPRLMRAALWLQEYSFTIEHLKNAPGNTMAMADFMSRAYKHVPIVTLSWMNLRNRVFNQIKPDPCWPSKPLSKQEFSTFADVFFESFEPDFPPDTEPLEKLKIQYFLKPSEKRQKELKDFEKQQKQGKQKQRYLVIKEKLQSISSNQSPSDEWRSQTETQEVEPPSEIRVEPTVTQEGSDEQMSSLPHTSEDFESSTGYETDPSNSQLPPSSDSEQGETDLTDPPHRAYLTEMHDPRHCLNIEARQELGSLRESKGERGSMHMVPGQGLRTPAEMAALQRTDPSIDRIIQREREQNKGDGSRGSKFAFKQGVLCFKRENKDGTTHLAVVIPLFLRKGLMRHVHGEGIGGPHLGSTLMALSMKPSYFWPRMQEDIEAYCKGCIACQYSRPSTVKQVGMKYRAKAPLIRANQRLAVDLIVNLPRTKEQFVNIFTIIDEFSRYIMMIPCKSKRPAELARLFQERWVGIIGVPECVHGDQGTELDSESISQMCKILGIRKSRTPSYSPMSNLSETANKTIGTLLKASVFPDKRATWWVRILQYLVMAYNETPSAVTGYKPREMIFGKIPSFYKLPLVSFEHPVVTAHESLLATRLGQEFLWQVVRAQEMRQRKGNEVSSKDHSFKEGDFVLVKDLTIAGPGQNKLKPRYKGPFRILKAYAAALLVQRWVRPQDKLDSGILLHHHTMNAQHSDARLVHPMYCKPYRGGDIGDSPRVHPSLVSNFLKQLGQLPIPYEEDESGKSEKHEDSEEPFLWDITGDAKILQEVKQEVESTSVESMVIPIEGGHHPDASPVINEQDQQENVATPQSAPTSKGDQECFLPQRPVQTNQMREVGPGTTPAELLEYPRETRAPLPTLEEESEIEAPALGCATKTDTNLTNAGNEVDKLSPSCPVLHRSSPTKDSSHIEAEVEIHQPPPETDPSQSKGGSPRLNGTFEISEVDDRRGTDEDGHNRSPSDEHPGQQEEGNPAESTSPRTPNRVTPGTPGGQEATSGPGPSGPPITRTQPRRAAKSSWEAKWPKIRKLELSESSSSEESIESGRKRIYGRASINLESDLQNTARKNTTTPTDHESPARRLGGGRLEAWVADEISPDPASAEMIITTHEQGEVNRVLTEAAVSVRKDPEQELPLQAADQEVAKTDQPRTESSLGPEPSKHDYVNV